jgi:rhamnosyl/mannosyltransferase
LQEAIRQICLTTKPFGVENTIFTLSPTPSPAVLHYPEATVVRCRSWAAPASCDLGDWSAFARFRQLARQADLVHYFFPWPFADVLRLLAPARPLILTYVSDVVRQQRWGRLYSPLMWHSLGSMRAIVSNAPEYASGSTVLSSPRLRDRVRIIPLGIDERSYPQHGDMGVLARLGLKVGEPFFLFIGVLRYYKGLHTLVRAAMEVGAKVVIAGSGPEASALRQQAARQGSGNVVFAGQVSDAEKVALLHACRALVLPSHLRSEAYGMVLVEAAMFGKPMVSCEIGTGTSFVNLDGVSGLVVSPENPAALAAAMNRLLHDVALAARYGAAARLRYEQSFSGPALGQAYARLYREVLGTPD